MNLVILGAGESGTGAAGLAASKGYEVFVSEKGRIRAEYKATLEKRGIPYEEGQHDLKKILAADLVVKSPGIPDRVPVVKELVEQGIPVISEIEFAYPFATGPIIGITGSNGKTTTSRLIHHLLQQGGCAAFLAGNMGKSFAASIDEGKNNGIYVLELSSFQLDGIRDFRPHIAAILNITPDHLDRYDYQLRNYIDSKFRIIRNQVAEDKFFYNAEDGNIMRAISTKNALASGCPIRETEVRKDPFTVGGQAFTLPQNSLRGIHNRMNAAFAIAIVREFVDDPHLIQQGLNGFVNVGHRMEVVRQHRGMEFINDSKATNVDAVYYALEAMDKPVIWIVGGQDKGNDYSRLDPLVRDKVKTIICLGLDNVKIMEHFHGMRKPMSEFKNIEAAIGAAVESGEIGDVVLLSPACASFDLFRNYEDRGDRFREVVLGLE